MDPYTDSSERTSVDFVLFGAGFLSFMLTIGGVVVASPAAAFAGGLLLLLVLLASS